MGCGFGFWRRNGGGAEFDTQFLNINADYPAAPNASAAARAILARNFMLDSFVSGARSRNLVGCCRRGQLGDARQTQPDNGPDNAVGKGVVKASLTRAWRREY